MLLAPSDIHFITDCVTNGLHLTAADESLISSVGNEICENSSKSLPKIQVSEKGGAYFALNNSSLHIYRELEKKGRCSRIQVDVVDLNKVPEHVQRGMIVSEGHLSATQQGHSRRTDCSEDVKKGYQKVSADGVMPSDHTSGADLNGSCSSGGGGSGCGSNHSSRQALTSGDGRGSVGDESDGCSTSFSASDYSDQDDEPSDTECDEDLTCNVCDRSFDSTRQLALHQQKKRHFGCSVCDSIFPSLMRLEHHKEALDHWSEDEGNTHDSDDSDDDDDDDDDHAGPNDAKVDELERLL